MALYSAYFDESSGNDSPVYVVAGFLSQDALWRQFEKEWKEVLGDFKISSFHAQHFAMRKGEFRGWREPQRRKLMASLLAVIQRRARLGFAAVVHARDFREVFKGKDRAEIGSVYKLCCLACFTEIGEWAKKNYQIEPVAHFFDVGNKNAGEVLKTYQEVKSDPKRLDYRLGAIAFESDAVVVPLQAADLAAYELWKWLDEHYAKKTRHGRYPLQEIVKLPWSIREFDKAILQEMLDRRYGRKVDKKTIHNVIRAFRPGVTGEPVE